MVEVRLVIADPKTGKAHPKTIPDAKLFSGKKIGDIVKGEIIDLVGYEFKITGGSDLSGFPMRSDVEGIAKRQIFEHDGVGIHPFKKRPNPKNKGRRKIKGMRLRKTVAGNTVSDRTSQLNLMVTKTGKEPLAKAEAEPAKGDS